MPYGQGDSAETASSLSLAAAARSLETMVGCWERQARKAGQRPEANSYWRNWAIASVNLGRLYAELGQQLRACQKLTEALGLSEKVCQDEDLSEGWETASSEILNKKDAVEAQSLRIFGDILRTIGQLDASEKVLIQSLEIAKQLPLDQLQAASSLSLGNTFRAKGNLERDRRSSPRYDYMPWCFVKREKFEEAETYYQMADTQYKSAIQSTSLSILRTQARLNYLSLILDRQYKTENQQEQIICPKVVFSDSILSEEEIRVEAQQLLIEMSQYRGLILENLPNGQVAPDRRAAVYSQINLAKSLAYLQQLSVDGVPSWDEIEKMIQAAIEISKTLDEHTLSYTLGHLGSLYEYCSAVGTQCHLSTSEELQRKAKQKTEEALYLAQPSEAPDIAYQWQWQMGRLHEAERQAIATELQTRGIPKEEITNNSDVQKKREDAIASYEGAIKTLELVRSNLRTINSDVQFSFRDNVEPVYRELVSLLLRRDSSTLNLEKAVEVIDSLQLTELENFLRCDLSQQRIDERAIESIDNSRTAVIYTIILKDRLEVIFKFPTKFSASGSFLRHSVETHFTEIEKTLNSLRKELEKNYLPAEDASFSPEVYNWLIQPNKDVLEKRKIDTLVFVLDGLLRNIPMSALSDGHRYLIENYAVALAPRLKLSESDPLSEVRLNALILGLSKLRPGFLPHKGFPELPFVEEEIEEIQTRVSSQDFLNESFVLSSTSPDSELKEQIKSGSYSVIHFATHGEFSSDPKKTFILDWNGRIDSNALRHILQNREKSNISPIELLVLSACKTADGDNRATLGLAGIALQSGARSTVASLWTVNDESTAKFMGWLYEALSDTSKTRTRAEALRYAQLKLLTEEKRPRFWAPYVIVGNWL